MSTIKYFHGTDNSDAILEALVGSARLDRPFHMTPDIAVARNYGKSVVEIELESEVDGAHIGIINKDRNFNKSVGNGIEVVVASPKAVNSLYFNLVDAKVVH